MGRAKKAVSSANVFTLSRTNAAQQGNNAVSSLPPLPPSVLTIQRFVVAGAVIVGTATLASAALVFMLSLRLRRREIETLFKLGGSRASIGVIMVSEIAIVLVIGVALAAGLTVVTGQLGAAAIRAVMRM